MSLWSMDPDRFAATDFQMEQAERREEWPLLHGDAEPQPPTLVQEINLCPLASKKE